MFNTNSSRSDFSSSDAVARSDKDNEEVHTENTSGRIIFKTKIDVLGDTETKAASVGKVFLL